MALNGATQNALLSAETRLLSLVNNATMATLNPMMAAVPSVRMSQAGCALLMAKAAHSAYQSAEINLLLATSSVMTAILTAMTGKINKQN